MTMEPNQPMDDFGLNGLQPFDISADNRPPNAFILFFRSVKSEALKSEEAKETKKEELDRMIGKMWQMADEQTRNTYREHAKQLQEAYKNASSSLGNSASSSRSSKRASKLSGLQSRVPEPINIRVILQPAQQQVQINGDPLANLKDV